MTVSNGTRLTVTQDELARRMTDYASIKDFNALTGGDLQQFGDSFRARYQDQRENWTANVFIDSDMEAFLWILTRDEESRNHVYGSVDEMRTAMERDLRKLNLADTAFGDVARSIEPQVEQVRAESPEALDEITLELLADGGYMDVEAIAAASDEELMQVKGIGRVRLHQIRRAQKAGTL